MTPSTDEIAVAAGRAAFGSPLLPSGLRGLVAETIVETAPRLWRRLPPEAGPWTFAQGSRRLALCQAAALQLGDAEPRREHAIGFDTRISLRVSESTDRAACMIVFAFHGEGDPDFADHRNPLQWRFFLTPLQTLPPKWRITLPAVRRHCPELRFGELGAALG